MDVRDLEFWMKEAQINSLRNRMEAFTASLLPYQRQEFVKSKLEETQYQIMSIEREDEIEAVENWLKNVWIRYGRIKAKSTGE